MHPPCRLPRAHYQKRKHPLPGEKKEKKQTIRRRPRRARCTCLRLRLRPLQIGKEGGGEINIACMSLRGATTTTRRRRVTHWDTFKLEASAKSRIQYLDQCVSYILTRMAHSEDDAQKGHDEPYRRVDAVSTAGSAYRATSVTNTDLSHRVVTTCPQVCYRCLFCGTAVPGTPPVRKNIFSRRPWTVVCAQCSDTVSVTTERPGGAKNITPNNKEKQGANEHGTGAQPRPRKQRRTRVR